MSNLNGTYKKVVAGFEFLKPQERFTLFLAALARGDDETMEALGDSCPTETWTVRQRDYIHRFDVAQLVAELVTFDVLTKLMVGLHCFDSKNNEVAQGAEDLLLAATAAWRGFERFCKDIGTSSDEVLLLSAYGLNKGGAEALHPGQPNTAAMLFEVGLKTMARFDPDEEMIERARKEVGEFWHYLTEDEKGKRLLI